MNLDLKTRAAVDQPNSAAPERQSGCVSCSKPQRSNEGTPIFRAPRGNDWLSFRRVRGANSARTACMPMTTTFLGEVIELDVDESCGDAGCCRAVHGVQHIDCQFLADRMQR